MKRLLTWLIKPAVLSFLGVVALSVLIWFQGPNIAYARSEPLESALSRWILIGIFFLIWALYYGWKWLAARRAAKQLEQAVAQQGDAPDSAREQSTHEIAQLSQRMDKAMALLRDAGGSKRFGRQYLYQIPWFMFVGAPGSGKTTALVHSGLQFPLSEAMGSASIGGVGGTRNCDWWFTDEAVLLDTAGRYTTQDSDADADKSAWLGFLELLKKNRPRRPINGVVVAVSVADLLEQDEVARQRQARAIRERIAELHKQLEIRFPVYVMVTKSDLLAGFTEYYEDLGKEDRAQVWGVTFPAPTPDDTDSSLATLSAEFKALEQRLNERIVTRLQQEHDLARRSLIYRFPQQFAQLSSILEPFLVDVFQANRYEQAPLLRGVYFSSGTQEGSPIDRVLGALSHQFGLQGPRLPANATSSARSYFITRLLKNVIFEESGIAGTNLKFERLRLLLGRGAMGSAALLVLIGSGLLINSYFSNKAYVEEVAAYSTKLDEVAKQPGATGSAYQLVPLLNAVRDIPGGIRAQQTSSNWHFGFGLSQHGKLGSQAVELYRRALSKTLFPRVVERLESTLGRGTAINLDYLYEMLRAYLMLSDDKRYDPDAISALLEYDFEQNAPAGTDSAAIADLNEHIRNLLKLDGVDRFVTVNPALIQRAQAALAVLPLDSRIYNRLKRNLLSAKLDEFSATSAAGADASTVLARRSGQPLSRGVPGLFTKAGYELFSTERDRAVTELTSDSWVLGRQEALQGRAQSVALSAAVEDRYFTDYIKQWDQFLADLSIRELGSMNEGARVLGILSGPTSPLRDVLMGVATQTSFEPAGKLAQIDAAPSRVQDKITELKNRLAGVVGQSGSIVEFPAKDGSKKHRVDKHFERLHRLAKPASKGAPIPLDQQLALLGEVSAYLDAAFSAKSQGVAAPPPDILNRVKREAQGQPSPLGKVMQDVADSGAALTSGSERARLNALWKGSSTLR